MSLVVGAQWDLPGLLWRLLRSRKELLVVVGGGSVGCYSVPLGGQVGGGLIGCSVLLDG